MTEVELDRMDLGRNQYVVSLELGVFQGRPKTTRPNSETVNIRPMAQEADSTHFFRPISVHPRLAFNARTARTVPNGKWSLGLMPFGLKYFGLIQLVTWLNFFKLSVSGIGHLA